MEESTATRITIICRDEAANFPIRRPAPARKRIQAWNLPRPRSRAQAIKKIDPGRLQTHRRLMGLLVSVIHVAVEIGIRRLEARRTATLCFDAKRFAEIFKETDRDR